MASEQPYNSIGQILASGGDIFVALKQTRGLSDGEIIPLFLKKYRPDSDDAIFLIFGLAYAGRQAAAQLNTLGKGATLADVNVPINPYLFGDEPGGLRYFAAADVFADGMTRPMEIRSDIPDIIDWAEVIDSIALEGQQRIIRSPTGLMIDEDDEIPLPDVTFNYLVARF